MLWRAGGRVILALNFARSAARRTLDPLTAVTVASRASLLPSDRRCSTGYFARVSAARAGNVNLAHPSAGPARLLLFGAHGSTPVPLQRGQVSTIGSCGPDFLEGSRGANLPVGICCNPPHFVHVLSFGTLGFVYFCGPDFAGRSSLLPHGIFSALPINK